MNQVPPPPPPPPPGGTGGGGYVGPTGSGSDNPWDIGGAFNWAWSKFTANAGVWIGAAVAIIVAIFVAVIVYVIALGFASNSSVMMLIVAAVFTFALVLLSFAAGYPLLNGALQQTRGETVTFQSMFDFSRFGAYIGPVFVQAIVIAVGSLLCYIPGIIAAVLLAFVPYFALDKGASVGDAFKQSYELVTKNLGPAILFLIVVYVVYSIGSFLCGIGVIVSAPVGLLMMAYGYRRAIGEAVAP